MKSLLLSLLLAVPALAADKDTKVYKLFIAKGKPEASLDYIRDVMMKKNARLGNETIGVWTPEPADARVFVLSAYKDEAAYKADQEAKQSDEESKAVEAIKAKHGKFSDGSYGQPVRLAATDFTPSNFAASKDGRVFELRTYLATKDNLKNLQGRFRDHTVKLFEKHGMTNVAYFKVEGEVSESNNLVRALSPDAGKSNPKGRISSDNGLIYLLAHKSKDAAKASFDAFRKDPAWEKAKADSEKKGSLTEKDGVISTFMKPAEFSPLK